MKPSLFKDHHLPKNSEAENKPIKFFKRKVNFPQKQSRCMINFTNLMQLSWKCHVWFLILVICKDNKTIHNWENISFTYSKRNRLMSYLEKKLQNREEVFLSNDVVEKRIDDISLNIKKKCRFI